MRQKNALQSSAKGWGKKLHHRSAPGSGTKKDGLSFVWCCSGDRAESLAMVNFKDKDFGDRIKGN